MFEFLRRDEGHRALAAVDKVLADRPHKVGHDFTAATEHLCRYRDEVIAHQRQAGPTPESRQALSRLNAVLSTVLAGHFPLGPIPWPAIEQARDQLADLVKG